MFFTKAQAFYYDHYRDRQQSIRKPENPFFHDSAPRGRRLPAAAPQWRTPLVRSILGIFTTCFVGVMLADYFIVKPRQRASGHGAAKTPQVNWSGVITVFVAFVLAHYVLNKNMPIEFFTSLPISVVLYPILRLGSGGRL